MDASFTNLIKKSLSKRVLDVLKSAKFEHKKTTKRYNSLCVGFSHNVSEIYCEEANFYRY